MLLAARRVATPTGLATARRALSSVPPGRWPNPILGDYEESIMKRGKQVTAAEANL